MTRYSFILLSGQTEAFLERIRDLGVVDITRSRKPVDAKSASMLERAMECKRTASELENTDYRNDPDLESIMKARENAVTGNDPVNCARKAFAALDDLKEKVQTVNKEIADRKPWGNFDKKGLYRISEAGYDIRFYCVPKKKFVPEWQEMLPLSVINDEGRYVRFVTIAEKGSEYSFPVDETAAPDAPYTEAEYRLGELKRQIIAKKGEILACKDHCKEISSEYKSMLSELDFYLANSSSESAVENTVSVLEGFAPTDKDKEISEYLENSEAFWIAEEAKEEDNPPVKLKNNWFARLFEPIGSMYMLPKYGELDLVPFFAPFYMLFFGMCLGDLGYSLIILGAGIAGAILLPKFRKYAQLISLLGIGGIVMSLLSGTIFGSSLQAWFNIPDGIFLSNLDLFWFSMIFGIFQIIFGRLVNAIYAMTHRGWQEGLSNIGWSALIIWITLFFVEWYHKWEAGTVMPEWLSYTLLSIAGIGILLFSKTTGNIFLRPIKGITSLYDITGVLGDVLSYIRLFALGVSGGILGGVFNSMALQLGNSIPYVGWIFCVLLLIVGHSLVMFLSSLSAFVHPMRLTFVEFYKNAGFEGGGREYNPLSK